MKVNLRLMEPNPFRNFEADPIDEKSVDALAASVHDHGFWGGIAARHKPNDSSVIQTIAGEHRRRAAIKAGIETVDIFVGDYDDDAAVQVYALENATQRGNNATAVAGSVAAAVRQVLLTNFSLVESTSENRGGHNRDGVGRPAIMKLIGAVPGITENVVKVQLANLKASGIYDSIVDEVTALEEAEKAAELEALRQAEEQRRGAEQRAKEAEERRKERERKAEEARKERERKAEAKRQKDAEAAQRRADEKAARAAEKAARDAEEAESKDKEAKREAEAARREAEEAEEKRAVAQAEEVKHAPAKATRAAVSKARATKIEKVTFDQKGVSAHFDNPSHVEMFMRLAVKHGDLLPVDQQAALAARLVQAANEREGQYKGHVSIEWIESKFLEMISISKAINRDIETAERMRQAKILDWEKRADFLVLRFQQYAMSVRKTVADLADLEKRRPDGAFVKSRTKLDSGIAALRRALAQIDEELKFEVLEIEDRHRGWGKPL